MGFAAKAGAASLAISVGVGAAGYAYLETANDIPGFLLHPADQLPPEITGSRETLVCAADTAPCTSATSLATFVSRKQISVKLAEVSPIMRQAIVDAEDRRFYEHDGCDAKGIVRAVRVNVLQLAKQKLGGSEQKLRLQGGSTIDRQTAGVIYPKATPVQLETDQIGVKKAFDLNVELGQQAYECTLALKMDKVYTKDQILEKYFNNIYLGRGATGIQAAAQAWYGVDAKDLTLQQSLGLAVAPTSPSRLDVDVTDDTAKKFTDEYEPLQAKAYRLADIMQSLGHITAAQNAEVHRNQIPLIPFNPNASINDKTRAQDLEAIHFVSKVKLEAAAKLGIPVDELADGGYIIHTTLVTKDQAALRDAIAGERRIKSKGLAAAAVSLSSDNAITAMVGNTTDSQVNIAIGKDGGGSGRDGGSILKGFVWAKGYEVGMPTDVSGKFDIGTSVVVPGKNGAEDFVIKTGNGCSTIGLSVPCRMTPEQALAASSNIATGKILNKVGGIDPIAERMVALGVDLKAPYYPSNVLGTGAVSPLGVATGYSNLVQRKGQAVDHYYISSITDASGKELYKHQAEHGTQVYPANVALSATKAMVQVYRQGTAKGTASQTMLDRNSVAGKTGTGDNTTDLWATTAFERKSDGGQTVVIWVGNAESKQTISGLTSKDVARIGTTYAKARTKPADFADITN